MAIKQQQINKIMKEYKDVFEALENYDKTGENTYKSKKKDKTTKHKEN